MADIEAQDRIEDIGADFYTDPHTYYRRWREHGPVVRVRFPTGMPVWLIVRYAEARAALADARLHKSLAGVVEVQRRKTPDLTLNGDLLMLASHMLNSDPPDHTRLRKMVNKTFTTRRVAAMRPRLEQITAALLDDMAGHDEVDLLEVFATPLPVTVICELLGVPFADRDTFQYWTKVLVGAVGGVEERRRCGAEIAPYLRALAQAKRVEPGEDLLSGLVQTRADGDQLSDEEVVSMVFLLLIAGHETTVNLISNGTYSLLRNESQFQALRTDPAAIPAAIEEFLRFEGPVDWATVRYTAEPMVVGETEIPAGEFVYVSLNAANRDPARWADPEKVDVTGETAGHLAFGHGIHFCVGAPLARLEAEIAFTALLQRFPDMRLAVDESELRWQPSLLIRGLEALPVRLHG
ncbi:cytochrome P450 [Nocardia brasiliensis]|uniref:Cytochrome P450 n=1 Tax=Nocardia brasiliensis TaxID=37326 RepID=A0A6G9XP02_NOCBR|nr:cytochrome P450 [Nocardia brasiliensis]QIS02636.1 cytochrome P450 [Nocardia brasiliensis]